MNENYVTVLFNDKYPVEKVPSGFFEEMWHDGDETYVVYRSGGRLTYHGIYQDLGKALEQVKILDKKGDDGWCLRVRSIEIVEKPVRRVMMNKNYATVLFNDEYWVEMVPLDEFKEMWKDYREETYVTFCNDDTRSTYDGTFPHLEKAIDRMNWLNKEGERAGKEQEDCWYDACILRVRSIRIKEE